MLDLLPGLAIILFSLTIHECAHGWVAERCGDDTARSLGRITLNPLPHIDPIGTVLLPMALHMMNLPLFGWAKPVPVNVRNLRHRRRDSALVSAAGPGANILVALLAALLLQAVPWAGVFPNSSDIVGHFLRSLALLNIVLAVFNLIPALPLDGGRIVVELLPSRLSRTYVRHAHWGQWILVLLFLTNTLPVLLWPVVRNTAQVMGLYG